MLWWCYDRWMVMWIGEGAGKIILLRSFLSTAFLVPGNLGWKRRDSRFAKFANLCSSRHLLCCTMPQPRLLVHMLVHGPPPSTTILLSTCLHSPNEATPRPQHYHLS